MNIFTFNTHEPYLYELAKTGHHFDVQRPATRGMWGTSWDTRSRPAPHNVRLLETNTPVDPHPYDLVLAQSFWQWEQVRRWPIPKVLLLHTMPGYYHSGDSAQGVCLDRLFHEYFLRHTVIVYTSHDAAQAWGFPGEAMPYAIDVHDYDAIRYSGHIPRALSVTHFFKERDAYHGYSLFKAITDDKIPFSIVGHNPGLNDSAPARDWDELRSIYASHRVYLNTTTEGVPLAMLEAMAAGMPIVTAPLPPRRATTLVRDGENGFVSSDPAELRERVQLLLDDHDVAMRMGRRSREILGEIVPSGEFQRCWNDVFEKAVSQPKRWPPPLSAYPDWWHTGATALEDRSGLHNRIIRHNGIPFNSAALFGPVARLRPGRHTIEFRLRTGWPSRRGQPLRLWLRRIIQFRPAVASLEVWSGWGKCQHARHAVGRWRLKLPNGFKTYRLTVTSQGETGWEFRVMAGGNAPFDVDPYATWQSIEPHLEATRWGEFPP
jgi:hypothetical protein